MGRKEIAQDVVAYLFRLETIMQNLWKKVISQANS